MKKKIFIALILSCISTAALATFAYVQVTNNNTGSGGYLLDDSAGFLLNDTPSGKLFAR